MISIVQGVVGGGKTIFAVRETLARVAAGGYVYTNVDMNLEECREYILRKHGRYMRPDQIRRLPECEDVKTWVDHIGFGFVNEPIQVVLDEAQMFWNSRDWAKTSSEQNPMLSFLTQSRKAGVDVMVISQDAGNIDKQFRVLAQEIVTARNMAHIAFPIFGFKLKGVIRYSWVETATKAEFRSQWWRVEKALFKCYRTEAFLDSMMQELAATKERLAKKALRKVSWQKRLVRDFQSGDRVEQWFSGILRSFLVWMIRRKRNGAMLKQV